MGQQQSANAPVSSSAPAAPSLKNSEAVAEGARVSPSSSFSGEPPRSGSPPAGSASVGSSPGGDGTPTLLKSRSRMSLRGTKKGKERKKSGTSLLRLRSSQGGSPTAEKKSVLAELANINALFDRFRSEPEDEEDEEELELSETDAMGPNGMAALLKELGLADEDDVVAFVVAWKLNCSRASRITRSEFVEGLRKLQCDSVEALRAIVPGLNAELEANRRDVFAYAFRITLPPNSKLLDLESARILLELFVGHHALTTPFVEWLTGPDQVNYRALNYDQYINFFDFVHSGVNEDLSNYDVEDGCWPSLFDEYYEFKTQGPKADGA